jgi:hypothetical protein
MRKIDHFPFLLIWYLALLLKLSQPVVISYYSNFSLIFMQDSGIYLILPFPHALGALSS